MYIILYPIVIITALLSVFLVRERRGTYFIVSAFAAVKLVRLLLPLEGMASDALLLLDYVLMGLVLCTVLEYERSKNAAD